jgi:hypothetical protein
MTATAIDLKSCDCYCFGSCYPVAVKIFSTSTYFHTVATISLQLRLHEPGS